MRALFFLLLVATNTAHATIYIFTPGKPAQIINKTAGGYTVTDMEAGVTQVMKLDGMSIIYGGGRPTSFIMDGGKGAAEWQGPVPALNPTDGDVNPVLPIEYVE